jgi:FAD-linked oxidoreductase
VRPTRSEHEGPREGALVASGRTVRPRRWWSNWAGNQRCLAEVLAPSSEGELARIVAAAADRGLRVKAVGSGHSFSGLALSDAVLIDLRDLDRVLRVDRGAGTVTVQAGIPLRRLSEFLWTQGLALENLGDIDVQTLAGATATGTHGTGTAFGCLSSRIVGLRIVDGRGVVHRCDRSHEPELFHAARVGLGALGIVSEVTLQVVPAFNLHAIEEPRRVDEVLESLPDLFASHDHFECFWVPHTGWALTKSNRRTTEPVRPRPRWDEFVQDRVSTNALFGLVNRVGVWRPSAIRPLGRRLPSAGRVDHVDRSYRVFASPRHVRFVEMEYAVPLEATVEAVRAVQRIVAGLGAPVSFPVEVRATAADDIPLSMPSGRPTGFVAVHSYRDHPHEQYFGRVEAAMRELGGRPHWGKLHRRRAADLAPSYPQWDEFAAVRERMDPDRRFANPELERVLGA